MSAFLLGVLLAGLLGGTIAYNCYAKREMVERSLRVNIQNLEYNMAVIRKEADLKVEQANLELKKARDTNKKAYNDIDLLTRDVASLKKDLEECQRRLREEL